MDIRTGRHCFFNLHVHLVFSTKYRNCLFTQCHLSCLKNIFEKVCENFQAQLVECQGEKDHVHLLVNYPTKIAVAKLVNSLKGVSSRLLRKKHPDILQYYWKGGLWSPSYFAGSYGGAPIDIVKKYIEQQNNQLKFQKGAPYIPSLK